MTKQVMVLAAWGALAFGCAARPEETAASEETREIVENLEQAGFPADDIMIVGGKVYVGRDAEVSLAASREMLAAGDSSEEQYRTTNLVSPSVTRICVDGAALTGEFSTALDLAIQNYAELPLSFVLARTPTTRCNATINAVMAPGVVGGSAGFPSNGLPYATIHIGDGLAPYGVDVIEHVITHELGHTIGFRHSDYYNRSISCGSGENEGDAGVGAIHVPGTPTTATVGGSIMNSCFRSVETGELTGSDVTALQALYPPASWLDFAIAFRASSGTLWVVGPSGPGNTGYGVAQGTSPSIARLAGGGHQVAFQAPTGELWTWGTLGTGGFGLGMAPYTSPSITALPGGGYQIAFQANTGGLWHTGSFGTVNTGLGMAAYTSPSITALSGGGYQIAFQAPTGKLWHTGTLGTVDTGLGMTMYTSPSNTALPGAYQIAFRANTGELWHTGTFGTVNTGLGMAANTSPSIAALFGGGFQIAFQAPTGLWHTGVLGTVNTGLGMAGHTSPSLAARSTGGFDLVFQANSGVLWKTGTTGTTNLGYGMGPASSPAVR